MSSLRLALATTAALAVVAHAAPTAAHALPVSIAPAVVPATRVAAPDPVGTYDWALDAQGSVFSGTLAVAKTNDTTFTATITHASSGEVVKAKYVKLDAGHLIVVSDTEYGDLTMDLKLADAGVEGTWKVGDGSYGGPLKVTKRKS